MHLHPRTWTAAAAAACLLAGSVGLAAAKEGSAMAAPTLEHGFRQDPMTWAERDGTLQGAMVRTLVLGKPKRGDKKLIGAEIDKILSQQLDDGRLDDHPKHGYQFTAEKLGRIAEAKLLPAKATESIAKAAAQYKAAAAAWHKTYGLLGHGATKEQQRSKKRREAGAALVRQALAHERNAIDTLKKALAALGK